MEIYKDKFVTHFFFEDKFLMEEHYTAKTKNLDDEYLKKIMVILVNSFKKYKPNFFFSVTLPRTLSNICLLYFYAPARFSDELSKSLVRERTFLDGQVCATFPSGAYCGICVSHKSDYITGYS